MSELSRRAGEIRKELDTEAEKQRRQQTAEESAKQAERERREAISAQRISEFIRLMTAAGVSTIPIYIEERYTPPNYDPRMKQRSEMGYTRLGEGWVTEEYENDIWSGDLKDDTFITTDGKVYGCQKTRQEPPVGAAERYARDWPEGKYVLADHWHEYGELYPYENGAKPIAFSDDDGIEILARALVRYGAIE